MGTHTVAQGDTCASLAAANRLPGGKWLYDHAKNAALRKKRPDPNLLFPGDKVEVPDLETKEESGAAEQTHKFKLTGEKCKLIVKLVDGGHKPHKTVDYTLKVDGKDLPAGKTDGNGKVEAEIPAGAKSAVLAYLGKTVELKIGHLDPIEEATGVRARLQNLGYLAADVDSCTAEEQSAAAKEFQRHYGLKVDGVVGTNTRNKLKEVHGC